MSLSIKLRALRSAKEMSLRQVAKASGVSPSTLSRAERDLGIPDAIILSKIAEFYGVSFESLLDKLEPTDEQVDSYLIGLGYNLEQLRIEINELIDTLRSEAREILAAKESQP